MTPFENLRQDLRYALRSIGRDPGLMVATVLTLALGIGLNVSVFTVIEGLLFRARVERDPASFAHLSPEYRSQAVQHATPWAVSVRDYRAFSARARTLRALAAWATVRVTLETGDRAPVLALLVTSNFFAVYGDDQPKLGRLFRPAECSQAGSAPVAIISEELWTSRFSSDPRVIGATLRVNRTPFTIVGVMAAGFAGRVRGPGIWLPWTMQALFYRGQDLFRDDSVRWLTAEGRLKTGHSRQEARSELAVIAAGQDRLEPDRRTVMTVTNGSFAEEPALRATVFWVSSAVMGALMLILAIACTNVTVLQLSRAFTRRREMGIRLSLGATRGRLTRMLLTESLMLAAIAGVLSTGLALTAPAIFARTLASSSTPIYSMKLDVTVLAYLGAAVLASACMAGLTPAGESLRLNLAASMKGGMGGSGKTSSLGRGILVGAQVALSLVLLVGAGLFLCAQYAMWNSDPGFETRRVLFVPLEDRNRTASFVTGLARRLGVIPMVESVASGSPFATGELGSEADEIRAPGQPAGSGRLAALSVVSANYFETLGISLVRGRTLHGVQEAVISQAMARTFWPNRDPLGAPVLLADGTVVEVVGIARDVQSEHSGSPDGPHLYRFQEPRAAADSLLVRFRGDSRAMATAVRDAMRQLDPESGLTPITLRAILDDMAGKLSLLVRMVCVLGGLALALAILGIHGVVTFMVSQRTKELGIRMALGATQSLIVRHVLGSGAKPIVFGLGAGVPMALLAARIVARVMLHTPVTIDATNPLVFAGVAALLAVVAVAAMFRPALRAARSDPSKALREE